jgi:hypothetical protein
MTQDLETILRKSLDETDHGIKALLALFLLMLVGVVAGVLWVAHLSETSDVKTMLLFSLVVIVLNQAAETILSCGFVTAMTRKTLKAIELLSKE